MQKSRSIRRILGEGGPDWDTRHLDGHEEPEEKREVQIGRALVELASRNGADTTGNSFAEKVLALGHELIRMHSDHGPGSEPSLDRQYDDG